MSDTRVFEKLNMLTGPMCERLGSRCWPFTGKLNSAGRPYIRANGKMQLAYRVVWELVHGEQLPPNIVLRHKCDNPVCCRPEHLEKGTHNENMKDMRERERHGLPHHTIRAIRKLASSGRTHAEIAELYGIGRSTVTEIVSGVHYGHVAQDDTDPPPREGPS